MTAQQVLDTAQSLYEKKLTTYPRTDCRYLPEEQFSDAARLITALSGISGLEAVTAKADSALKGPVWDTKKSRLTTRLSLPVKSPRASQCRKRICT